MITWKVWFPAENNLHNTLTDFSQNTYKVQYMIIKLSDSWLGVHKLHDTLIWKIFYDNIMY